MRVSSNKLLQKYAQPTSHNAVTLLSAQNLSDSNFPEAAGRQYRSSSSQRTLQKLRVWALCIANGEYKLLYFLSLKNFPAFLIVFPGLLSIKRAVVRNDIETPLEVLCSSKLNFQFLEMNFQNERTVRYMCRIASWHERPGLNPKLFGSNFASHSGSRAILASACVPRSCMMGMPSGRFSGLPGLGIQIRRTGFTGACRSMVEMSCSLCGGVRFLAPSTPAVFFPLFSCVTL